MKISSVIAMSFVCGLAGGISSVAWAGDLDSALEEINISTEAQGNTKKGDDVSIISCTKADETNCPTTQNKDASATVTEATSVQQAIFNGQIQRITINGAPAIPGQQSSVFVQGF